LLSSRTNNDSDMRRLLLLLAVPAGVLALAFLLGQRLDRLPAPLLAPLPFLPEWVALLGMVLAGVFNRSRMLFLLAVVALMQITIHRVLPLAGAVGSDPGAVYQALCLLIPINFVVFASLGERGLVTWRGALRFAFLALQIGLVAWLATERPAWLHALAALRTELIPGGLETPVPHLALFLFVLASLILLARLLIHRSPLEAALLGALVACAAALHVAGDLAAASLFATAAGVIAVLAILQDSHQMAYRDELTELPARRALKEDMLKLSGQYVIAMVDVDHFKRFNDRYGHDTGDQVLRMVASRLARVSGGGKAYRYGGEEFTLVFPGKALHESVPSLEAVCGTIASTRFTLRAKNRPTSKPKQASAGEPAGASRRTQSKHVALTVSIGSAERNERHDTPAEVLKAADRSLYWAKKLGRNRVCS
jgi:diguanylate cyclase (GGDEF)-like protein